MCLYTYHRDWRPDSLKRTCYDPVTPPPTTDVYYKCKNVYIFTLSLINVPIALLFLFQFTYRGIHEKGWEISSHPLFVTYTIYIYSIYSSANKQLRRYLPYPFFVNSPVYIIYLFKNIYKSCLSKQILVTTYVYVYVCNP